MHAFALPLFVYYIAIIAVFCAYGVHRYWLLWRLRRAGGGLEQEAPAGRFDELPRVTVQLPMFNEAHVAERVIRAACAIDYPRDRLQIQVLDDSTDDSAEIARHCCERMAEAGHDVEYRHRDDRLGYKAGALAEGLRTATGQFVALFDADFVPPPHVLRRAVDHFTDESIGMVQMRWEHLNRGESLLTEIQALCLDAHFVIEQAARARSGCWFNFNGTAGIWRRACIEDAGGWQHDTLTEDTDLSYRAQLAGWRFRYLPDVTCPAELPATVGALMTQQHRWNKGLIQSAIKLLPTILRSPAPLSTRLEAWFHLTSPLPYAAMFLLTLLTAPAFFTGLPATGIGPILALALGVLCLALGTVAACVFCVASQRVLGRPIGPAILRLPALMAIGVGVSLNNTRAIIEALWGRASPFVRTPKHGAAGLAASGGVVGNGRVERPEGECRSDPAASHRRVLPAGTSESALGALMIWCVTLTFTAPFTLVGLPFILLFAAGYLAIGIPQLLRARRPARAARATPIRPLAAGAK